MDKKWQFENGTPIYLQMIDQIGMDIVRGALKPGDKVPPVRTLATAAGVTPNTVQRALTALEEQGLVYTKRTSGRFVTKDERRINDLKMAKMQQIIVNFFETLKGYGLNREEIISAVESYGEDKNGAD